MRIIFLAVCTAAIMSGCATPPPAPRPPPISWTKVGATFENFMSDRFACAQAGRVTVASSYVNQYGGSGSSNSYVDRGQFMSCMGARGYTADFNGYGGFKPPAGSEIWLIN